MLDLFREVTELLGKPEGHPDFCNMVKRLHEEPSLYGEHHIVSIYRFLESGFEMHALADNPGVEKSWFAALFWIDIPDVRNGHIKPYRGEFMNGVSPHDSIEEVRRKMPVPPGDFYAEGMPELRYDFDSFSVHFSFHESDTSRMASVSVRHIR
jgi:hypothetical protein